MTLTQIFPPNFTRIVLETVRRISYEISGVKGFKILVSLHTHCSHFSLPLKGLGKYYATGKISPPPIVFFKRVKYAYEDKHLLNLLQKAFLSKLSFSAWREGLMMMTFSNYWTTFRHRSFQY